MLTFLWNILDFTKDTWVLNYVSMKLWSHFDETDGISFCDYVLGTYSVQLTKKYSQITYVMKHLNNSIENYIA